jgi:hypothetical protein
MFHLKFCYEFGVSPAVREVTFAGATFSLIAIMVRTYFPLWVPERHALFGVIDGGQDEAPFALNEESFKELKSSGKKHIEMTIYLEFPLLVVAQPFSTNKTDIHFCGYVNFSTNRGLKAFGDECLNRFIGLNIPNVVGTDEFRPFLMFEAPDMETTTAGGMKVSIKGNLNKADELSAGALFKNNTMVVMKKPRAYTSFTLTEVVKKGTITSRVNLEKIIVAHDKPEDQQDQFFIVTSEEQQFINDTFEMEFICRFILTYIVIFQEGMQLELDSNWDTEATRRILLNIFVMFLGIMTGKSFSTELRDPSRTPNKGISRLGSGPLDYLLVAVSTRVCKAVVALFLRKFWRNVGDSSTLKTSGDLFSSSLNENDFNIIFGTMQQKISTMVAPAVGQATASSNMTSSDSSAPHQGEPSDQSMASSSSASATESLVAAQVSSALSAFLASKNNLPPTAPVPSDILKACAERSEDPMDADEDGDGEAPTVVVHQLKYYDDTSDEESPEQALSTTSKDPAIFEAKKLDLMNRTNLDHSLGQLSMQMADCIKMHTRKSDEDDDNLPNKRQRTLPFVVKGILSTAQTSLFFEMKKYPGSSVPELTYSGMVRINVFPKQKNRISGLPEGHVLSTKDVSYFLIQHYAFITREKTVEVLQLSAKNPVKSTGEALNKSALKSGSRK